VSIRLVKTTPFGRPVAPDVKATSAGSSASRAIGRGDSAMAFRSRRRGVAPKSDTRPATTQNRSERNTSAALSRSRWALGTPMKPAGSASRMQATTASTPMPGSMNTGTAPRPITA